MEKRVNLILFSCALLLIYSIANSLPSKPLEQLINSIATLQKSVDALKPAKPKETKLPEQPISNPTTIPNLCQTKCQTKLKIVAKARDDFAQKCDELYSDECKVQGVSLSLAISAYLFCLNPN
ncbi:MAG: hypothetical protein WC663_05955 [Patescibacteria group bacterium]|jgi:hypothetical protein